MQFDTTLSQSLVQPQNGLLEEDGSGLPFIKSSAWKVNKTGLFGWFPWKISRAAERLKTLVIYHLQEKIGPRFRQMVYANFRNGKFRPGIALTNCTNKFHLPENNLDGLKLVSKMALKKRDFSFGIFRPEKTSLPFFVNGKQALNLVYADEMFQTEIFRSVSGFPSRFFGKWN